MVLNRLRRLRRFIVLELIVRVHRVKLDRSSDLSSLRTRLA